MSAPAYVVTNLAMDAFDITSSTADPAYPAGNLADGMAGRPFRFTVTTGGDIEVNFGAAKNFDTVALLGHNFQSLTGSVKAGNTANPSTVVAALTYRAPNLWADCGNQNAQFVHISVSDANTEASAIGELIIGKRVALPRPPKWGVVKQREERDILNETVRGVIHANHLFGREYREPSFRFPESEYEAFKALHTAAGGRVLPFLWLPNPASSPEAYFMRKEADFRPLAAEAGIDGGALALWYDYTLQLTEESFGVSVLL
jgi:hypothetical protein